MSRPAVLSLLPQTPPEIICRANNSAVAPQAPTFALYTLGCKVNQYDSHQIARALAQRGFRRVEFRAAADLYVIDTCTVTAEADRKSRKAAARACRNNSDAVVAITGCAAAYAADQFRRVAPDALVLNNAQKLELPELAIAALSQRALWAQNYQRLRTEQASEPLPSPTRERAVLKIQDGCNHKCAFCIIPTVRGASQTKPRATVLAEAGAFVHEGARELVVTGVSMSDWGRADDPHNGSRARAPQTGAEGRNSRLCSLLRAVAKTDGVQRVRISSLDPADVDDEFLATVARTPNICPHIHLALQSGSAGVLRAMRRRYTPAMFRRAAQRWREICPDGGLTTDIIVGFPGETEADFEASMQIATDAAFSAIHVFPYSPRQGTAAAQLQDAVPAAEQAARVARLLQLGRQLSQKYADQFLGQTLPIMVEGDAADSLEGLTPHYLKACIPAPQHCYRPGDIAWFTASEWRDGCLHGSLQTASQSA